MEYIHQFLKSYLFKKIKNQNFILIINSLIVGVAFLIILIKIEENVYFSPIIKNKLLSLLLMIYLIIIIYIIFKSLIHIKGLFGNSNYQQLAFELINKISAKDKIINALQIYSNINLKNSYSDLTIQAISEVENDLKKISINNIKFNSKNKNLYILLVLIFTLLLNSYFSMQYINAMQRLITKDKTYIKPLPFELIINHDNKIIFKGEDLEVNILSTKNIPNNIKLNKMIDGKIESVSINKINESFTHSFKNFKKNTKIWATYLHESKLPFNRYKINSDTLTVILKNRPEFKELSINIIPPLYTNINEIKHNQSMSRIEVIKGSTIKINGLLNKKISEAIIKFDDINFIYMSVNKNKIESEFTVEYSKDFEIICYDYEDINNIPIVYSVSVSDDLNPYVRINYPEDNLKINEIDNINLEYEMVDDFGISIANLEYYIIKPYYLNQDTIFKKIEIFNSNEMSYKQYMKYNWNIKDLYIGPGDEIFYWLIAKDNNTKTGPGIGKSNTLKAYFPNLEELYFEVEEKQEIIEDDFDEMIESIDEIKTMYESISNNVLKEKTGFEQEQESKSISEELKNISEKISNLESTIKTIEELNNKNNLINDQLGNKIQKLQDMFKNVLNEKLMEAIQNIQESLNEDDYKKSLEDLNDFNFEMSDLEQQLDRMIDLFEQIVAEQKLDELTKKMESMYELQKEITDKINQNHNDKNIKPMVNKQNDNLKDLKKTFKETSDTMNNINENTSDELEKLISSIELSNISKENNDIIKSNNKKELNQSSKNNESNLEKLLSELEKIKDDYEQQSTLEMLNMYSRIMKNLIYMSYEQEVLIKTTESIKNKKDSMISKITSKENILLEQYKNVFIQISDLSKKSFHISAETTKTFSQIFNYLMKTIHAFEQGKIKDAKNNQFSVMNHINKTILLLLESMQNMQSTGDASGYSQYMESMEDLLSGQQSLNQGMGSLLPMPFGEQPSQDGLMQSLMQQQQSLKNQLEKLMKESSFSNGETQGESLGKALDEMDKIIKDFENNNISQESINRGEQIYKKLLEHKNSERNRGFNNLWEAKQNDGNNLLENNLNHLDKNDIELKKLYEKLEKLNQNQNINSENKTIIKEYLRILIKEKINEK